MSWHRIKPPVKCVCNHSDYCMINGDGSEFLCMRIASDKPFTFKNGDVGHIHRVTDRRVRTFQKPEPKPTHLSTDQLESMLSKAIKETSSSQISMLAKQLGVKVSSLLEMRVGFSRKHLAWFFPMRDGHGRLVGLRTRDWYGNKRAVTGSKGALFIPYCHAEKELFLVEGASDTAAMRSMNLFAIGRPSCSSGASDIKTFVEENGVSRVIIIADNDGPGINGAESLSRILTVPCCIMALPTKDVREFVNIGGTAQTLECMANNVVWRNTH